VSSSPRDLLPYKAHAICFLLWNLKFKDLTVEVVFKGNLLGLGKVSTGGDASVHCELCPLGLRAFSPSLTLPTWLVSPVSQQHRAQPCLACTLCSVAPPARQWHWLEPCVTGLSVIPLFFSWSKWPSVYIVCSRGGLAWQGQQACHWDLACSFHRHVFNLRIVQQGALSTTLGRIFNWDLRLIFMSVNTCIFLRNKYCVTLYVASLAKA
jgi:hypothetical protein